MNILEKRGIFKVGKEMSVQYVLLEFHFIERGVVECTSSSGTRWIVVRLQCHGICIHSLVHPLVCFYIKFLVLCACAYREKQKRLARVTYRFTWPA